MTTCHSKECKGCGETKPLAAFYADKRKADGLEGKCKECRKSQFKQNYHNGGKEARDYRRVVNLLDGKISKRGKFKGEVDW